jgi:hypothetical protein
MYSKPSPPAESDGQACEGPNSCQSVGSPTFAFLNMIKRLTQLCHYSVLENGDPLEMILSHLQYDHALLAKLLEVCPLPPGSRSFGTGACQAPIASTTLLL